MPILILLLILIVLIAQIGFWKTFAAVLGGIAMLILFAILLLAAAGVAILLIYRRISR